LAFYNYELPAPTWEIYADGRRVTSLPFACKAGSKLAIRDGVTWIGIVPLPGSDLGRTNEVLLRAGEEQKYLNDAHHATAALVIDNFILQRAEPLAKDYDWAALDKAATGFAVEFADAADYADFQAFLKHMQGTDVKSSVDAERGVHAVAYVSGTNTLEMGAVTLRPNQDLTLDKSFTYRRANGAPPDLPPGVERVSPFSIQASTGVLDMGGATLKTTPGQLAVLQREPHTGTVLAANPLAELNAFSLKTPENIEITAIGKLGVAIMTVDAAGNTLTIEHAFLPEQAKQDGAADALVIFGLKPGAVITLNGQPLKSTTPIEVNGRQGCVVPLKPDVRPAAALVERYGALLSNP
jgi:hypothetical protein